MIPERHLATRLVLERPRPALQPSPPPSPQRALTLVVVALRFATWVLWRKASRRYDARDVGVRLRTLLTGLGGMWVKVGQLLSMRSDVFGREFCRALAQIQDRVAGFPGEEARHIVETELERSIEQVFSEWDAVPFVATTMGQSHRARLRHRDVDVAVKVQRPHIARIVALDLRYVRRFCHAMTRLRIAPYFRWEEFYEELDRTLTEELDYRFEVTGLRRMRQRLSRHRGMYVPQVFKRFSTRRVLVTEFLRGTLMSDLVEALAVEPAAAHAWMRENQILPRRLARRLHDTLLRQVFEDDYFHGDPHPGNIVLLKGNRVAFLELGAVGTLERRFLEQFRQFHEEVNASAYGRAADILLMLSPSIPAVDLVPLRHRIMRTLRDWATRSATRGLPFAERSSGRTFSAIMRALLEYHIPVTWQWLRVDRATVGIEASIGALDSGFDLLRSQRRAFMAMERRELLQALRGHGQLQPLDAANSYLAVAVEHGQLKTDWMFRQARIVGPTQRRFDFLVLAGIHVAVTVLLLAMLVAAGIFVRYRAGDAVVAAALARAAAALPELGPITWSVIGAILTISLVQLIRLRSRFRQPVAELTGRDA